MYKIEFYETADGVSELWDFLDDLQKKSLTNKDARIQHKQIAQYIQLLEDHGTRLGEKITKHLDEDIWELRPGDNRVLFFYHKDDTYVLLHHFRKKTQKTPPREIAKDKSERDDWIKRKGNLKWLPGPIIKITSGKQILRLAKILMKSKLSPRLSVL